MNEKVANKNKRVTIDDEPQVLVAKSKPDLFGE